VGPVVAGVGEVIVQSQLNRVFVVGRERCAVEEMEKAQMYVEERPLK